MISRNIHLMIATALWAMVGLGLLMAGLFFTFGDNFVGAASLIIFVPACALGVLKGIIVLPRVAKKNRDRILALPEASPFYMTFSIKSWLLILSMILLGRVIRAIGTPSSIVGGIYVAVGMALLLGSRCYLVKEDS